jgi:hypothetical protein
MQFASIEEIVNLFKSDHDYLLNLTFGPKKLKLFDMITDLKEILIDAHDMPYLKYSEHGAIMNRHHDLDNIVHELTIASA